MPRKKKKVVLPEPGTVFDESMISAQFMSNLEPYIPRELEELSPGDINHPWRDGREVAGKKVEEWLGMLTRYFQSLTGISEKDVTDLYGRPGISYRAVCIGLALDVGCELHGDLDDPAVLQRCLDHYGFTVISRALYGVPCLARAGAVRVASDPEKFRVGNPPVEWVLVYGLLSAAYMMGLLIVDWPHYRTAEYPDGLMHGCLVPALREESDESGFVPVSERSLDLADLYMKPQIEAKWSQPRSGGVLRWAC